MCRVLIVDDNERLRRILIVLLQNEEGIEVVGEAGDGLEAVSVADSLEPDVLILDLEMPRMHGLGALPLIRRASPQTRVIVYTSDPGPDSLDKALELGAVAYIHKDQAAYELTDAVRAACRSGQMSIPDTPSD